MLQHDRQLKAIAISLEKKIRSELLKMQKDEREEYIKFWNAFGYSIKAGAYANYGADKEKLLRAADFYVNHIRHVFTVSTLRYLIKGGRLSKWKGTAGELLDMKPVLIVDKDGSLQVLKTIRGRKKSLKALIEYAQENIADPSRQIMGICHGEDPDSLQYTKDLLLQAVSPKELVESTIGCAIGAHTGRGIIGIVFFDAMNDEFDV